MRDTLSAQDATERKKREINQGGGFENRRENFGVKKGKEASAGTRLPLILKNNLMQG